MSGADKDGDKKEKKQKTAPHLLDYEGLVQVLELIDHLKQEGRYPKGETEMACDHEEDGYDGEKGKAEKTSEEKPHLHLRAVQV